MYFFSHLPNILTDKKRTKNLYTKKKTISIPTGSKFGSTNWKTLYIN